MIPDLSEKRFCQFVGGAWRVPHPQGAEADLERALALAGSAQGAALPALPPLPVLIRPGSAVLLATPEQQLAALAAIDLWCGFCDTSGAPRAALSLLQPVELLKPPVVPGWRYIPLFRSSRL